LTPIVFFIADFIEFHNNKLPENLSNKDVEAFIESVFIKRQYSVSTQRQFISAIKQFTAFYPETAISDLMLERPKKSKILPTVLSQEEMIRLIQCTKNLKHRAILAMIYSAGLRIGELLNLKLKDIQVHRMQLFVQQGKGRKDRYVSLASSFMPLLQNYLMTYEPRVYFVEGEEGRPYSASSVRKFLSRSVKAAKIDRRVTPHTLRHSYATHLLESGVGLRHIQELLGHAKPETTMIYTHVARRDLLEIKSPLDYAIEQMTKNGKAEQKFLLSRK
jgi:site-specific recombinase XerD